MAKIYIKHIRKCGYCVTGFIKFCQERDLDYKSFFKNGIEVEELLMLMKGEENTLVTRAMSYAMEDSK